MNFTPPTYAHRAYYVFHKTTGQVVYSHRFMTIAGDDRLLKGVDEQSIIAAAARRSGHTETDLQALVETGIVQHQGLIAGVDVKSRKLLFTHSPRPGRGD